VTVHNLFSAVDSGVVYAQELGNIFIGGDFVAGKDDSLGTLENSGVIRAGHSLKSLTIVGNVVGDTSNHALISARGQLVPGATTDVAIGSIKVGGNTKFLEVIAGAASINGPYENADAQIGNVVIAGNCVATSIAAGVNAGNGQFGDLGDYGLSSLNDQPKVVSRIASIVVGGTVSGTGAVGDHYGFVAEQVGSVKISGKQVLLTSGAGNDLTPVNITVITNDVSVLEVL